MPETLPWSRPMTPQAFVCSCAAEAERLAPPRPEGCDGLEPHFHLTHDDLGFVFRVGERELRVNACQASCARVSASGPGIGRVEAMVTDGGLTAGRARREVLGFVAAAIDAGQRGLEWVRERDPARPAR